MKELGHTEVELGVGNRIFEFTHDDELFVLNALKLAAEIYGDRLRLALVEEGKAVDNPDVEVLSRLSHEYGIRAGYIGKPFESRDYERLSTIVYERAQEKVENDESFAEIAPHYSKPVTTRSQ